MIIFLGILSMCFSVPFLTSPSAPMTTGTVIVFNPHIFVISISRSLYLDSFSATFSDLFRSEGIAISISMHVFSCLSLIMMSVLLALTVFSVCTCISQRMVTFSFSVSFWLLLLWQCEIHRYAAIITFSRAVYTV